MASRPNPKTTKALRKGVRPPKPYKSWFEFDLAEQMKKAKVKAKYEKLKLPYLLELIYKPDWELPNGIIIEAKGKLEYETRRKMEAVKKANPDLDIRFVFMEANNKLSSKSKMRYWQWAERHGFPWAQGAIPEEWFKKRG